MNDCAPPKQKPTVIARSRRSRAQRAARPRRRARRSRASSAGRAACTRSPRRAGRARPCGRSSRSRSPDARRRRSAPRAARRSGTGRARRAGRRRRSGPRRGPGRRENSVPSAEVSVRRSPAAPPAMTWKPGGRSGTIASKGKHMSRNVPLPRENRLREHRRRGPGHRGRAALVRPHRAGRRGSTASRTCRSSRTSGRWRARGASGYAAAAGAG